jgi:hypothetical protein
LRIRGIIRREVTGLTRKSIHKFSLGFSDKETVKLDFDDTPFKVVKNWAERACNWFNMGGFIILRSSKNHYHVVFDRNVTWIENIHIMCWVASESKISSLKDYVLMQGIKETSTLRIGKKGVKPSPRIVNRFGEQKKQIDSYLLSKKQLTNLN